MTLSLCLLCAAIAPAPRAEGQDHVVVVRAPDAHRAEGDALALALVGELVARGERAWLPLAPEPEPDERASLEAAERDYQMLRPERAAEHLEAALARVDERGGGLPRELAIRAWLLLAMARAATGHDAAADLATSRALAIDPRLAPDPARYPPPLRERVERLRATIVRAPLVVEVTPSDAEIEIDGARGAAESEVVIGTHVVRASARRARGVGRAVDVGVGGARVALALELDARAVLSSPGGPDDDATPILAAAQQLGTTVVLVDLRADARSLALEARDGTHVARATLARNAAPADVARVAAALVDGLRAPTGEAIDPVPWILAGSALAVTAAIAIAIGVAMTDGAPAGFDARGEVIR